MAQYSNAQSSISIIVMVAVVVLAGIIIAAFWGPIIKLALVAFLIWLAYRVVLSSHHKYTKSHKL